ncbi:hypothetical protein DL767_002067 [Monosporascus sp. MG133]|nr:hypothetical protein DL767_002067 [Monosporascus sp. MG133]
MPTTVVGLVVIGFCGPVSVPWRNGQPALTGSIPRVSPEDTAAPCLPTIKPRVTATLRAAAQVRSARHSNSPVTTPPSRKNENIVAVYVQILGEAPIKKCEQCIAAGDNTKWGVCIVAVDPDGQAKTKGACACCHYNKYGQKCSFRNGQVPRFDNNGVRESGDRDEDGNGDKPEVGGRESPYYATTLSGN